MPQEKLVLEIDKSCKPLSTNFMTSLYLDFGLIESGFFGGLASSSIYHFTQYTPNDIKLVLNESEIPVRI